MVWGKLWRYLVRFGNILLCKKPLEDQMIEKTEDNLKPSVGGTKMLMFERSEYLDLEGFQVIDYVATRLNLDNDKLADILEEDSKTVESVIEYNQIPDEVANYDYIYNKFYLLVMLINYSLKIAGSNTEKLRDFWDDTSRYDEAINKPPWYEKGLYDYLSHNKYEGLKSCIEWIAKH